MSSERGERGEPIDAIMVSPERYQQMLRATEDFLAPCNRMRLQSSPQTLFGYPIVVSDALAPALVSEDASYEEWIAAVLQLVAETERIVREGRG
jgi:hypothetical protein